MTSADHICCKDIIQAKADIEAIEMAFVAYREDAQRWRDQHEARNVVQHQEIATRIDAMGDKFDKRLENIESKLTTYINPVVAVVISVLTASVGLLAGALYVFERMAR